MYDRFLNILHACLGNRLDFSSTTIEISKLFYDKLDLVRGFNIFLPDGYSITVNPERLPQITVTTPNGDLPVHSQPEKSSDSTSKQGAPALEAEQKPFYIIQLTQSSWLIREHDKYGEYPNIFAKFCRVSDDAVIVLSDSGCATSVRNEDFDSDLSNGPEHWNLRTFLEATINPSAKLPYLVITTHCHYDHILGITHLPPAGTSVMTSNHDKDFVTPYSHLQQNSLCDTVGVNAPHYTTEWLDDMQAVRWDTCRGQKYPGVQSGDSSSPSPTSPSTLPTNAIQASSDPSSTPNEPPSLPPNTPSPRPLPTPPPTPPPANSTKPSPQASPSSIHPATHLTA